MAKICSTCFLSQFVVYAIPDFLPVPQTDSCCFGILTRLTESDYSLESEVMGRIFAKFMNKPLPSKWKSSLYYSSSKCLKTFHTLKIGLNRMCIGFTVLKEMLDAMTQSES